MAHEVQILQALDHIMEELQGIKQSVSNLTIDFHDFEKKTVECFDLIEQQFIRIIELYNQIDPELKEHDQKFVQNDASDIRFDYIEENMITKNDLERTLGGYQEDIRAMLAVISSKISEQDEKCDCKLAALNERFFVQEGYIQQVLRKVAL